MNWDDIQGNWSLFRRRIKQRWHRFTDEQLDAVGRERARLVRAIGDMYQLSPAQSEQELAEWQARQRLEAPH